MNSRRKSNHFREYPRIKISWIASVQWVKIPKLIVNISNPESFINEMVKKENKTGTQLAGGGGRFPLPFFENRKHFP